MVIGRSRLQAGEARSVHQKFREIDMAKRKAAKKTQAVKGRKTKDAVEPAVVKLAVRLGSLLGRAQSKVDAVAKSAIGGKSKAKQPKAAARKSRAASGRRSSKR